MLSTACICACFSFNNKLTVIGLRERGNFVDWKRSLVSNLIPTYPDQRSLIEVSLLLEVSGCSVFLCLKGYKVKLLVRYLVPGYRHSAGSVAPSLIIIAGVITLRSEVSHRRSFTVKRWTDKRRAAHQTKSIVCLRVSFDLPICRRKWHFCPRNAWLRGTEPAVSVSHSSAVITSVTGCWLVGLFPCAFPDRRRCFSLLFQELPN